MSTSLKTLAGVLLAIILITSFTGIKEEINKNNKLEEAKNDIEELKDIVSFLRPQETNTRIPYELKIPNKCKISFMKKSIVLFYPEENYSCNISLKISGPDLTEGSHELWINRVENGLRVNVR